MAATSWSHKVQAASLAEAWWSLDDAFQEEQQQTAKDQRMAKPEKRPALRLIEGDAFQRPGVLHELHHVRVAYGVVFRAKPLYA